MISSFDIVKTNYKISFCLVAFAKWSIIFHIQRLAFQKGLKKKEEEKKKNNPFMSLKDDDLLHSTISYWTRPICKKLAVKLKQIISSLNFPRFPSFLYTSNNMPSPLLFFSFYFMFISFSIRCYHPVLICIKCPIFSNYGLEYLFRWVPHHSIYPFL